MTTRPKFRFSLRALLIFVAISTVLSAWLGIKYAQLQREAKIVEQLLKHNAQITSHSRADSFFDSFTDPFALPAYDISLEHTDMEELKLIQLVGKLRHVRNLFYTPKEDLRELENLTELRVLELTGWTQESLEGIENCRKLEKLYLYNGDRIQTLEPLRGMNKLEYFYQSLEDTTHLNVEPEVVATWENLRVFEILACDNVSLRGFEHLQDLETLDIGHADDVSGFEALENMKTLRRLSLPNCSSLETLDFCREMSQLRELVLYDCAHLKNVDGISGLKNLEKIWLTNCKELSDLSAFEKLTSLKKLTIVGGPSDNLAQRESLQKALPKTNIRFR